MLVVVIASFLIVCAVKSLLFLGLSASKTTRTQSLHQNSYFYDNNTQAAFYSSQLYIEMACSLNFICPFGRLGHRSAES